MPTARECQWGLVFPSSISCRYLKQYVLNMQGPSEVVPCLSFCVLNLVIRWYLWSLGSCPHERREKRRMDENRDLLFHQEKGWLFTPWLKSRTYTGKTLLELERLVHVNTEKKRVLEANGVAGAAQGPGALSLRTTPAPPQPRSLMPWGWAVQSASFCSKSLNHVSRRPCMDETGILLLFSNNNKIPPLFEN